MKMNEASFLGVAAANLLNAVTDSEGKFDAAAPEIALLVGAVSDFAEVDTPTQIVWLGQEIATDERTTTR